MAVSNWLMIGTLVFLLLPNKLHSQFSDATIFNYTRFLRNEPDLIFQGDARTFASFVSLTPSVGRVLFSHPIRLWDRAGRRQANFQTEFTGYISGSEAPYGISFFVAPVNAAIPTDSTTGGNMGLYDNSTGTSPVPLLAVELDVFVDSWDPNYRHVGINLDSRDSVAVEKWDSGTEGRFEGGYFDARITYDARQRLISAFVSAYIWDSGRVTATVEHTIDLKTLLPEWVQIGFSASTRRGVYAEHIIHSWSFISFMVPDHDDVNRPDEDNYNHQYV